jgi:hypothetical protein
MLRLVSGIVCRAADSKLRKVYGIPEAGRPTGAAQEPEQETGTGKKAQTWE